MTIGYYGDKDSFAIGVVEDVNDPLKAGRVRVRVYGLHSDSADELPFTDLPWSQVMLPITEAGISGIGRSPTGLRVGSLVYCRFLDGDSKQQLLVLGAMAGLSQQTKVQSQIIGEPALIGASTPERIYNYLRGRDLTPEQAAGIVGSLSSLHGPAINYGESLGKLKGERLAAYKAYAAEKGAEVTDLRTQLDFMYLKLAETAWPNILTTDRKLKAGETAEDFSESFTQNYLETSTTRDRKKRKRLTGQAYETYSGGAQPEATPFTPKKALPVTGLGSIIDPGQSLYDSLSSATRPIKELIVHHTDTYENMQTDAFDVEGWHKARGFDGIGYHYLILRDGRLQIGRDIGKVGSHARKRNTGTVGIAFVGGRKGHSSTRKIINSSETFTDAQWRTFNSFIRTWVRVFPNSSIIGHGDVQNDRTDPNFDVRAYVANLAGQEQAAPEAPSAPATLSTTETKPPPQPRVRKTAAQTLDRSVKPVAATLTPTYTPKAAAASAPPNESPVVKLAPPPILPQLPANPFIKALSSILGNQTPILPIGIPTLDQVQGLLQGALSDAVEGLIDSTGLDEALAALPLGGLAGVDLSGVGEGDVLSFIGGSWVPVPASGGGGSSELSDLTGFGAAGGYIRSDGSNWVRVSGLAWADLTGVPSSFTPSTHTHAISDVTGLQTALDGKASSTHSHAISDITGLQTAIDGKASVSHTHAASDIASGTFADAQISQASVTQHQAALSIGWAQLSGVPSTFAPSSHTHGLADLTGFGADGGYLRSNGSAWARVSGVAWADLTSVPSSFTPASHTHAAADIVSGTFADALVAESNVTQHEGALTIDWTQLTSVPSGGSGDVNGPGSSVDDNIVLFDGTSGSDIKDSGVSLGDIQDNLDDRTGANPVRTADFNFVAYGPKEIVDTTAGIVIGTLPASPTVGMRVEFADGADFSVNAFMIDRNGELIGGLAEDCTVDTQGDFGALVFIDGSTGWMPIRS